jgi:hypothetical protein
MHSNCSSYSQRQQLILQSSESENLIGHINAKSKIQLVPCNILTALSVSDAEAVAAVPFHCGQSNIRC